ncbi:hypothetical protein EB118_24660, partial [bacterium]|nr:hypothetical protein [bacterium]
MKKQEIIKQNIQDLKVLSKQYHDEAVSHVPNRGLLGFYAFAPVVTFIVSAKASDPITTFAIVMAVVAVAAVGIGSDYISGKNKHRLKNRSKHAFNMARGLELGKYLNYDLPDDFKVGLRKHRI